MKNLYTGLAFLVFYGVIIHLAVILPSPPEDTRNAAFVTLFAAAPRVVVASIAAYFATELANSFVMSRLKVRFQARYFYGRALRVVGTAQLMDALVFFGLAYAGTMPLLLKTMAASWPIVMACEIVILPLTRKLAIYIRNYEGVQHYDRAPVASPQI